MTEKRFIHNTVHFLKHPLSMENDFLKIMDVLKDLKAQNGNICFEYKHYKNYTKRITYYNLPCTFDIETTHGTKASYMYIWQFNISGITIYGRTWDMWERLLVMLNNILNLSQHKLYCYIQNINYEYQFIRKRYKDKIGRVFATEKRKVIYFEMYNILFLDSYQLYGTNLENIAKEQLNFPYRKTHDLDYSIKRNSQTILSNKELKYCLLDVITLSCAIFNKIQQHKYIYNIPLTKTGYARRFFRELMYKDSDYTRNVKSLTIDENEYCQYKRAFSGGFSHGNYRTNGKNIYNVISLDECSEYPSCDLLYKYPKRFIENVDTMSEEDIKSLDYNKVCWVADVTFTHLKPKKDICDNILSYHKCKVEGKYLVNNGRLVYGETVYTSITNIDYESLDMFYTWDEITIKNVNIYTINYLPKSVIMGVVSLFCDKNILKGKKGYEEEYKLKKELLNSGSYGAMVEDIVKNLITFDNNTADLVYNDTDIEGQLKKYNESNKRFNYYLWGVFITSYARRDLYYIFNDMRENGISKDYQLSDTDSIKARYSNTLMKIIEKHNARKKNLLLDMCRTMKIPQDTVDILLKYKIGQFEIDNEYLVFKQYGAKRYIYIDKNYHCQFVIAGLPKKAVDDCIKKYGKYRFFQDVKKGYLWDNELSHKLTHYYIDDMQSENINGEIMTEYSSINLDETTFKLSYSSQFEEFFEYIKKNDLNRLTNIF